MEGGDKKRRGQDRVGGVRGSTNDEIKIMKTKKKLHGGKEGK